MRLCHGSLKENGNITLDLIFLSISMLHLANIFTGRRLLSMPRSSLNQVRQTNLPVDLGHDLLVPSRNTAKEEVHLFQTEGLGFGNNQPDEECTTKCNKTKEDVRSGVHALKHIRSDLTDNKIVHPIA